MINANIKSVIFAKWAYDGSIFVNEQIKNEKYWSLNQKSKFWFMISTWNTFIKTIHHKSLDYICIFRRTWCSEYLIQNFGMITCRTWYSRIDITVNGETLAVETLTVFRIWGNLKTANVSPTTVFDKPTVIIIGNMHIFSVGLTVIQLHILTWVTVTQTADVTDAQNLVWGSRARKLKH